ncbi:MAG: sulfatase-like hydrolase/transferase, partial [Verrucomicrobiota bacterium]
MSRPNFLFLITDSQGHRMVGTYANNPTLGTERLDRLAEEGIRFDRAYCPAPICTPCRAAMFSGIHAHTSGPWTNNLAFGTNVVHMGQRFRDLGYETPYVGKWHLDGQDYFGSGECPDGWDPRYWY